MNKLGRIAWLLCGLSILILGAVRFIMGGWVNFLWIPFGVSFATAVIAVMIDLKFYAEFLTLRTTKHGMNMGALIGLVVTFLVAINFLSTRFDHTFDLTQEGLNSLSDASQKVLDALDKPIQVKTFYKGSRDKAQKNDVKNFLGIYKDYSRKVKLEFIDSYLYRTKALQYLQSVENEGLAIFVEYDGRKVRVQNPISEEKITAAMIKATRKEKKKIYFIEGHGEKEIHSKDQNIRGLSLFKKSLEDSSFAVDRLSLIQAQVVPEDASILAIVGPLTKYLERELDAIREFARDGGKLFIAADPEDKHNMPLLTKTLGVEYQNNFVLNATNQMKNRRDASVVIGFHYDPMHEITKYFSANGLAYTIFPMASELKKASDIPNSLKVFPIVKSLDQSFSVYDLNKVSELKPSDVKIRPHTVAIASQGALKPLGKKSKNKKTSSEFSAVVFGDSDFISNGYIVQGLNKDLALNSIAYLAKEKDLISIRPKRPVATVFQNLTELQKIGFILFGLGVPILFFISSGVLWFKRRSA